MLIIKIKIIALGIVPKKSKGECMTWFLLGMLVMWFVYPLLRATQTTMVVKWNNLTMNNEEINETTTIGFKTGV